MGIIKNELKKIFNIKSLLVLSVISFVIYKMFISFYIDHFPNGRPAVDIYDIAKRFIEEEGINTSEIGVQYFLNLEKEYEEEADNYILNNKVAQELGVSSRKELKELIYSGTENSKKAAEFNDSIIFEEPVDAFWKLEGISYFIEQYDRIIGNDTSLSEEQNERIDKIINSESYRDVIPEFILENYNGFIFNSTALILISIIFLLAPIFTKDKHRNLEQIQYTTKRGRKLYKDKIIASLIASGIIVTVELSILFFLYLTRENTVEVFYNSSINSWLVFGFRWFDLTFKEYIFVVIALVYILSISVSLFIAFISRKCNRYISLTGISLLLTLVFFKLVTAETLIWGGVFNIYTPKFLVIGFLAIMAVIGIILILVQNRNEKKRSVLN